MEMSSDAIATFDKITSGAQLEPAFPLDVAAYTSTGALDLLDGSDDLVPYIPTLVPMALPSLIGMENDRGDDLHLLSLLHHFPELHEASASMPMVSRRPRVMRTLQVVSYLVQPEDDGCLASASRDGDAGDAGEGTGLRGHALLREFEKADEPRRLTLFLADLVHTVVTNVRRQCGGAAVALPASSCLRPSTRIHLGKDAVGVRRETSRPFESVSFTAWPNWQCSTPKKSTALRSEGTPHLPQTER
jgi:hypothetical protein